MKRFSVSAIVSLSLLLMFFTVNTGVGADMDPLDNPGRAALMVQINGSPVEAPPEMDLIEGQVMVPIRWAAEQMGAISVEWDGDSRTITIISPQDFYSLEKLAAYNRGLKVSTDELESRIWPLPGMVTALHLSDLLPDRPWTLELGDYKVRSSDPKLPPASVYIHITDPDGLYEHGRLLHSAENHQGHYYVPMDWLGYLFNAWVNYDPITNMLSVDTPDIKQVKSEIDRIEHALIPSDPAETVKLWGRGEQTRNGALQYLALSPELRQIADQSGYVRQSYWVTGGSSPWVGPITIESWEELGPAGRLYTLSFPEMTSSPPHTTATEKLLLEKRVSAGQEGWFITGLLKSSSYGIIDGPHDYMNNGIDGDGKSVTAQIKVDNDKNRWDLTVSRDGSETGIEVFKGDKKGFEVSTIAIDHIIGSATLDFLLRTDYRSMPFGGMGYELYSLKDGEINQVPLSKITDGTPFSVEVDEDRRQARISVHGATTQVALSDWDIHGYRQYGPEFCQNFFITMDLHKAAGEMLPTIYTTEVIAATLPHHLTYLHTEYKYIDGAWQAQQTYFSDQPPPPFHSHGSKYLIGT